MFNFSRSRKLVSESFSVLKKDKELVAFPIISAIAELLIIGSFAVPLFYLGLDFQSITEESRSYLYYGYLFLFYLVTYSVVVFFNAGLVFCAHKRLTGGDPTFREGIQFSVQHWKKILYWALLSATIGTLLRVIADKGGILGKIFSFFAGTTWSLVTYLIVPILVVENLSVTDSIKHSVELFKKTWGEQVKGELTMGLYFFFLFVIPIPFAIAYIFLLIQAKVHPMIPLLTAVGVLIAYWIFLSIISTALQAIFTAALYLYAKTETVPAAFTPELIKSAFQKKEIPQNQS